MKKHIKTIISIIGLSLLSQSCITSYDPVGRPIQTVEPSTAALGAVSAGVIGYALGSANAEQRQRQTNTTYMYYNTRPTPYYQESHFHRRRHHTYRSTSYYQY